LQVEPTAKPPEFEQALEELEQLVERLERGDLPLEDALKSFERGVELTRHCQGALRAAQARVELLLQRNGQAQAVPFAAAEEESAAESSAATDTTSTPPAGQLQRP